MSIFRSNFSQFLKVFHIYLFYVLTILLHFWYDRKTVGQQDFSRFLFLLFYNNKFIYTQSYQHLWITLWITYFVFTYKQSYPHYPQFYMPYPLLSYPHSIHSFFPLIHMLSTAYPQYYPHFIPMLLIFFTDCSPLLSWNSSLFLV